MKFKKSILTYYSIFFIAAIAINTIVNYEVLSGSGGWGIVAMIGLLGIGAGLIIVDLYNVPEKVLGRYMGTEKAQHYLATKKNS